MPANQRVWRKGGVVWHLDATEVNRAFTFSDGFAIMAATTQKGPLMEQLPRISIQYCDQCRWMLRATWCAQELLTTFQGQLGEVALIPGSGGIFEVRCDDVLLWSRKEEGGFPEMKVLKQRVRDQIAPGQSLGHSDG